MTGHYLFGCDKALLKRLLQEHKDTLDPRQKARIRQCVNYTRLLSPFAKIERAIWDGRIERTQVEKPPLFILGHWRSGTTYLFNLLSCDPDTAFMDSMTTFTFHNFLLLRHFLPYFYGKNLTGDRFGDDMEFLATSPQEECYAIANCTEESFSHLLAFPQDYQKYIDLTFEDTMTAAQRENWCRAHSHMLKKITYFRGGRRILLKSPDNTAKMGMIHDLYPEAKFIHIYRDPYKVILSTLNLFEAGIRAMTFQEVPSHEVIEDTVIALYKRLYTRYFEDMARVPREQLVEIAYADLVKAPMETLESVYRALDLPGFEAARERMQAHIDSQKHYKTNQFSLPDGLREKINRELAFFFEHYHIPMQTS